MLSLLIYGTDRTAIGFDEFLVKCPSCKTHQWAEIMLSSVYYHIYYIPVFPIDKDVMVVCKKCGLKRYGETFDSKLISNYEDVKKLYRHKWFTYIGAAIIALPFVIWLLLLIIKFLK